MKSNAKGLAFVTFLLLVAVQFSPVQARESKDVILVLDTSMSMIGYGGKDILENVKDSIGNFIDKLEDGDRVTFMTFDADVRIYPPILVDDENDRDIIKKYITMTEAKGKWTYTLNMLQKVFEKADELAKDKSERETVIVIMTDGLDDPPPGNKKHNMKISNIAKKYEGKDDWWIYLVSFQDLKTSDKIQSYRNELAKVSDKTSIIEASQDPSKGIEQVQREQQGGVGIVVPLIIAGIVLLLVIIIIIIVRRNAALKVQGLLTYWNHELLSPYEEKFNMTPRLARAIFIGKGLGCQLNLHESTISPPFAIEAVRDKEEKKIRMELKVPEGLEVEFKNKEEGKYLDDGDIFVAGDYTFKYNVS